VETGFDHWLEAAGATAIATTVTLWRIIRTGKLLDWLIRLSVGKDDAEPAIAADKPGISFNEEARASAERAAKAPHSFCYRQSTECHNKMDKITIVVQKQAENENDRHDAIIKRLDEKRKKMEEMTRLLIEHSRDAKDIKEIKGDVKAIKEEAVERTKQFHAIDKWMSGIQGELKGWLRRNGHAP